MEFLKTLGEPATHILAIAGVIGLVWAGIKYIPKGHRWLRSWKFIKREELARFKQLAEEYEELRRQKPFSTAVQSAFIKSPEVKKNPETDIARRVREQLEKPPQLPETPKTHGLGLAEEPPGILTTLAFDPRKVPRN
jgi:hypothetical protein